MKKSWLKYLCDPVDKRNLFIDKIVKEKSGRIITGTLKSRSGNIYQIKDGVPILLTKSSQSLNSVKSFEYEWKEFDFDYGKDGWVTDIVEPLFGNIGYFKNKVIIDCGSGSGRQSMWMVEAGAKLVFSLELSNVVRTNQKKIEKKWRDKIFAIQCDISFLPINIKNIKIDLVYCINVIQHTANPKKAVWGMAMLLNRNSYFAFNIYLEKGRRFFLNLLGLARRIVKPMPLSFLKYLTFFVALFCYFLSPFPIIGSWFRKSLPLHHSFKETWLNIYDILGSHQYQKFYSERELKAIIKGAKLKIMKHSKYALLLGK